MGAPVQALKRHANSLHTRLSELHARFAAQPVGGAAEGPCSEEHWGFGGVAARAGEALLLGRDAAPPRGTTLCSASPHWRRMQHSRTSRAAL